MLLAVTVTNERGESLRMELRNPDDSGLYFTNIDGIGGATATINSSDVASMDGAIFNSARLQTRNIVFTIKPTSDPSVEVNRHKIYRYFPVKSKIEMEFETDVRITTATGYVESVNATIFSERETVQISVICMDPCFYMYKPLASSYGHGTPNFEFEFSDDSVEQLGVKTTNENLILNANFLNPAGYPANSKPNMITLNYLKDLNGYTWTGEWRPEANEWIYYANSPDSAHDYQFVKDGIVISRSDMSPYDDPAWLIYFYRFNGNEQVTGDYCMSFVSKEFGGISRPFSLVEGEDSYSSLWLEKWGNCRIAAQYEHATNFLEIIIQVFPGAKVTLIEAKLERGGVCTLFGGDPKRQYTSIGQTIRYWDLMDFDSRYHTLDIKDSGAQIQITPGAAKPFKWGQKFRLEANREYTLSVSTPQSIYSTTFTAQARPSSGWEYDSLNITDALEVFVYQYANSTQAEVLVKEKTGNSSASVCTIQAIKLEYGSTQTLVDTNRELLTPYELRQNEGTIEFGIMTKTTIVTIDYDGDVPVGITATILSSAAPGQMTFSNGIGESIVIDTSKLSTSLKEEGGSYQEGDEWLISTHIGKRSVQLRRKGKLYNCLGLVDVTSQWPQLYPGSNAFQVVSHYYYPSFDMEIEYQEAYGGV